MSKVRGGNSLHPSAGRRKTRLNNEKEEILLIRLGRRVRLQWEHWVVMLDLLFIRQLGMKVLQSAAVARLLASAGVRRAKRQPVTPRRPGAANNKSAR